MLKRGEKCGSQGAPTSAILGTCHNVAQSAEVAVARLPHDYAEYERYQRESNPTDLRGESHYDGDDDAHMCLPPTVQHHS